MSEQSHMPFVVTDDSFKDELKKPPLQVIVEQMLSMAAANMLHHISDHSKDELRETYMRMAGEIFDAVAKAARPGEMNSN